AVGQDDPTRDQIRIAAPVLMYTNQRLVDNRDFELAALTAGAVRARILSRRHSNLVPINTLFLLLATSVTQETSREEAQAVWETIQESFTGRDTRRIVPIPVPVYNYTREMTITLRKGSNQSLVHEQ